MIYTTNYYEKKTHAHKAVWNVQEHIYSKSYTENALEWLSMTEKWSGRWALKDQK